ncbi:hypothetical protein [uncultured Eubacterium sp.]|uniref:hypothetical protein n=1 Tax=uncultured Eubacterium sp. TaxID=165185 RepID=UPI00280466C3|nr:hypothetical protein [uncultured Eubacterium sp.]
MKVSLFLPDEMYNRVRLECEKQNLKTSQFIQIALEHEFNTIDAESSIKEMMGVEPDELYNALNGLSILNEKLKLLTDIQKDEN